MSLKNINEKIRNKEIIIFGTGDIAKKFVKKFGNELKIRYFTSNNMDEKEFENLIRIDMCDICSKKNIYFVICTGQFVGSSIFNQLNMNYKFFDDYIDSEIFSQLLEGKTKLLLVDGLCHEQFVAEGLKSIKTIYDEYIIKFFWNANLKGNILLKNMFQQYCQYAEGVIKLKLKGDAWDYPNKNVITVPLTYFPAIFPQISVKQEMGATYLENPYMLRASKRLGDIRAYRYTDNNVVTMLKNGLSQQAVLEVISDVEFYSDKQIEDSLFLAKKSMMLNDAICDIKLSDFVLNNYKHKKLFLDGMHWSNLMLYECIRQIIKILNIKEEWINKPDIISELASGNAVWESEVPVYPSVKQKLAIEWADDNTKYKMVRLKETEELSFEEYMKKYISYAYHSLKLQEVW